jgi:hypothetical protein
MGYVKVNWEDMMTDTQKLLYLPFVILAILLIITSVARCEEWADEQIVNAIYLAEGGEKAQYLYGIRSVKYDSPEEARKICFNTVRNNRKRYADYGYKKYDTYLEFLASRYCPIGCDNDRGTNKYWLKNVRYFLSTAEQGRK